MSEIIKTKSPINYEYATIKITKSRIDKGLIAIPKSFSKWFPEKNSTIKVYLGSSNEIHEKTYSSYSSSTRESRIGGMSDWFNQMNISKNDEIVIQVIDQDEQIYKIIPENEFIST